MRLRLKYKTYCFADHVDLLHTPLCLNVFPMFYDQRVKIPDDVALAEKKEIYKDCYFYNPRYTLLNTTRIFFFSLPKPITIIDGHITGNFKYGLHADVDAVLGINKVGISLKTTDEKGLERVLGSSEVDAHYAGTYQGGCFSATYPGVYFFSVNTKKIILRQKLFLEIKTYGQTEIRNPGSCVNIELYNNMEIDIPVI